MRTCSGRRAAPPFLTLSVCVCACLSFPTFLLLLFAPPRIVVTLHCPFPCICSFGTRWYTQAYARVSSSRRSFARSLSLSLLVPPIFVAHCQTRPPRAAPVQPAPTFLTPSLRLQRGRRWARRPMHHYNTARPFLHCGTADEATKSMQYTASDGTSC